MSKVAWILVCLLLAAALFLHDENGALKSSLAEEKREVARLNVNLSLMRANHIVSNAVTQAWDNDRTAIEQTQWEISKDMMEAAKNESSRDWYSHALPVDVDGVLRKAARAGSDRPSSPGIAHGSGSGNFPAARGNE